MKLKVFVNVAYFWIFFLITSTLHLYHLFLIAAVSNTERLYFGGIIVLQSAIETALFVLLTAWLPRFISFALMAMAALVMILRFIDFPLVRMMDLSVWSAIQTAMQERFANVSEQLKASNVSLDIWFIGGAVCALAWLFFFVLFLFTERRSKEMSLSKGLLAAGGLSALLLLVGSFSVEGLSYTNHKRLVQSLLWKTNFFSPELNSFTLAGFLERQPKEERIQKMVEECPIALTNQPNICLFIIESLRDDYINETTAPHFSRFKRENISFPLARSNANATHISWFSLFYSQFPFYWNTASPPHWTSGSPSLKLFKRLGYKVHVYSSARMNYYHMDEVLFGKAHELVDTFQCYWHEDGSLSYLSDQEAMDQLMADYVRLNKEKGHIFIAFLDSTHFAYSFPKKPPPPFAPIVEEVNYLKLACTPCDLEGIKNRYRNAIFYLDTLFGRFLRKVHEEDFVVVTSDHGEEFNEEGHFFHASSLNAPQTAVPLYYKVGRGNQTPCAVTSHMDVFPTLLHLATGREEYCTLFQGESIFKEGRWPYAVSARYNAGQAPYEFLIQGNESKLLLRLDQDKKIYDTNRVILLAHRDPNDNPLPWNLEEIEYAFRPALERIFSQIAEP